ncbi:MAG TPA: GNAT family N-acetyltransferase [Aggregatilineales bacterium]|nr:GNAT family N-acetyltransferase [Aggregatilineales bacterium]
MTQMHFHRNWIALFEAIANEIEGAYCWRDAGVFYGITGMDTSVFNVAILEDRQPLTAGRLERIGVQMMNIPLPYSIQFCHHLRQPQSDLAILERGHYLNLFIDPLRWHGGALPVIPTPEIRVRSLEMGASTEDYTRVVITAFDLMNEAKSFLDLMLRLRNGYHVVAYLEGEPVGTGTVMLCGGVAGVYNVAAMPGVRRRGVGRAIMTALHAEALRCGYPGTALASSTLGIGLYAALGYQDDGYQLAYEIRS